MSSDSIGLPRVYADFHNADNRGRLRLNCRGTIKDLLQQKLVLPEGLVLMFYMEDVECVGTVTFSNEEKVWAAVIDWNCIKGVH